MAKLNEKGHEILDSTPVSIPAGFKHPLPIAELVRKMVTRELSYAAAKKGHESFEEADDFDTGDEPELRSKYELDEDQENAKFITEEPKDGKREGVTGTVTQTDDTKDKAAGRRKNDKLENSRNRKSTAYKSVNDRERESAGNEEADDEE